MHTRIGKKHSEIVDNYTILGNDFETQLNLVYTNTMEIIELFMFMYI